jgi:hypothetical protein
MTHGRMDAWTIVGRNGRARKAIACPAGDPRYGTAFVDVLQERM